MIPIPIIILNWNGLNDTIECITSLLAMDKAPVEIILVDNGSTPEEREGIVNLYKGNPNINLVLNMENKGFTRGNSDIVNDIMSRPHIPEFVALLNNDTVVSPDWINQLLQTASDHNADIVSSKMINYYDRRRIDNLGHFMLNTGEILPLGHREEPINYQDTIDNMGACGGAALYRTSMIEEIGFFDLYFDTGYEDAELGLRAKLLGYKSILSPKAIVYHKVSRSINKIRDDQYLQHIQKNIFYTYIKLMPTGFLCRNSLFVFMKYMMWLFFGVLTFQFKLIALHSDTIYSYIKNDLKRAISSREEIYLKNGATIRKNIRRIGPIKFFLITDIRRLFFHLKPR